MASKALDKNKRRKKNGRGAWIMACLLLAALILYLQGTGIDLSSWLTTEKLWRKLGRPLFRIMAFMSVGLFIGQLIESLGWTTRLGRLVRPLIHWARLPGAAGVSFTSAFISGVMANTLLFTAWQEGRLNKQALVLTNLLNSSLPSYLLHMPTTMFVIVSLTGRAGVIYVLLTLTAALIRMFGVLLVSRLIRSECEDYALEEESRKRSWGEVWSETWPKFRIRLLRLVSIIVPVYLAVVLAAESGFFSWLQKALASWLVLSIVPVEAMSLIIFSLAAEFTSGFAAAGALLQSGALGVKSAVLALLIGNVAAAPVRALRHQLPHYMAIYSPGLGLQLIVLSQVVRILSLILAAAVFILLY